MGSLNINRKLFKRSSGISLLALVALIALLIGTGTVFAAAPIAGVGGFVIEADNIQGTDFELIPALTSTNTASSTSGMQNEYQKVYPAAQVWLGDAKIDGLNLWKNISLAAIAAAFGIPDVSYCKVQIEATGQVLGSNLTMNTSDIEAVTAAFTGMTMMENLPTAHANKLTLQQGSATTDIFGDPIHTGVQIGMSANTMLMDGGIINTHYMKADSMTIPGMTLKINLYRADDSQIMPAFQNHNAVWD